MRRAVVLAIATACRHPPIASCDDDLRGVYTAGAGTERWMVLDEGPSLEAYALFPDADGPADLVVAPRVIDLSRDPAHGAVHDELRGTLRRRYMRRADSCDAELPVRVTRCTGDALDIELIDPAPPTQFVPCAWPAPGPSRMVRWRRE
jgi:hypothetical protein